MPERSLTFEQVYTYTQLIIEATIARNQMSMAQNNAKLGLKNERDEGLDDPQKRALTKIIAHHFVTHITNRLTDPRSELPIWTAEKIIATAPVLGQEISNMMFRDGGDVLEEIRTQWTHEIQHIVSFIAKPAALMFISPIPGTCDYDFWWDYLSATAKVLAEAETSTLTPELFNRVTRTIMTREMFDIRNREIFDSICGDEERLLNFLEVVSELGEEKEPDWEESKVANLPHIPDEIKHGLKRIAERRQRERDELKSEIRAITRLLLPGFKETILQGFTLTANSIFNM